MLPVRAVLLAALAVLVLAAPASAARSPHLSPAGYAALSDLAKRSDAFEPNSLADIAGQYRRTVCVRVGTPTGQGQAAMVHDYCERIADVIGSALGLLDCVGQEDLAALACARDRLTAMATGATRMHAIEGRFVARLSGPCRTLLRDAHRASGAMADAIGEVLAAFQSGDQTRILAAVRQLDEVNADEGDLTSGSPRIRACDPAA
jgi:hypothetical protein